MANMVRVQVDTMEMVDGTHNKYYRVYQIPSEGVALIQYGSQKNGRSGGAANLLTSDEGYTKRDEKRRKGYVPIKDECLYFETDWDKLSGRPPKEIVNVLEMQFVGALRTANAGSNYVPAASRPARNQPRTPSSNQSQPAAAPVRVSDRLLDFKDEMLSIINIAPTDETAALKAYASINERLEAFELEMRNLKSYKEALDIVLGI